jgi:hypothetical protein
LVFSALSCSVSSAFRRFRKWISLWSRVFTCRKICLLDSARYTYPVHMYYVGLGLGGKYLNKCCKSTGRRLPPPPSTCSEDR